MMVILPYYPGDEVAAGRLSDWIGELGGCKGHELLLVPDCRASDLTDRFRPHFDKVTLTWITDDAWNSWPDSANNMFRKAFKYIEFLRTDVKYALWLEPDAVPLIEGWADKLEFEFKEGVKKGKRFMGDRVAVENVPLHMSGIGVYPSPLSDFAGEAYLAQDIAWDCYAAGQILPKAHFTKLIEHAWKHPAFTKMSELATQIRPETVLFHASKDGSLIELLRKRKRGDLPEEKENGEEKEKGNAILSVSREGVLNSLSGGDSTHVSAPSTVQAMPQGEPPLLIPTGGEVGGVKPLITDIFIKTYEADFPWLEYCLRSIDKFATGFRKIIIVLPKQPELKRWYLDDNQVPTTFVILPEHCEDGYLSQQIFKVYSDSFSDADFILHIDSDTMFTRPVIPDTFLQHYFPLNAGALNEREEIPVPAKPIWMMTPIRTMEVTPWAQVMKEFMDEEPEYEFMRRFPFVLPRWFYKEFRTFIQGRHKMNADEYIKSRPYRHFSEFNCMGFYAWKFYRDRFAWVDTSKDEWPELTVEQLWSHGGLTDEIKERREKILSGGVEIADTKEALERQGEIDIGPANPMPLNTVDKSAEYVAPLPSESSDSPTQTFPEIGSGVWPNGMGEVVPFPKEVRFHAEALAKLASDQYRRRKVRDALKKVELIR